MSDDEDKPNNDVINTSSLPKPFIQTTPEVPPTTLPTITKQNDDDVMNEEKRIVTSSEVTSSDDNEDINVDVDDEEQLWE